MTQAITSFAEEPAVRATRASDVVAPLGDALWANVKLHVMGWLPSKIGYDNRLADAQLGKGTFSGRGPMRRLTPTSPILSLDEQQRQVVAAGLTLDDVKLSEGKRADALNIEIDHALETKGLEGVVARADQGLGTQFLLGATGLAVDFADPVNLMTMAIPGVGEVKAAALFAKATARLGPTLSKYAVRAGVGAYEGAVSSAMLEPIDYAVDQRLGNEHSLADAAWNIGLGALGGSILRVGGGAGADLYHSLRLRQALSVDGLCATMDDVLRLFGQGRPVHASSLVPEQDARLLADGSVAKAPAVSPPDLSKPISDALLVAPSHEIGGDRASLADLIRLNEVRRQYHAVESTDAASTTNRTVYRVRNGNDVVIYASDDGKTFTVQRLDSSHPDHAAPLSRAKEEAEVASWEQNEQILFVRPTADLSKGFEDVLKKHVDEIGRKSDEELMRYFPPGLGGHTVEAEIGQVADKFFKQHALTAMDLHPGWKQTIGPDELGLAPDAVHLSGDDPSHMAAIYVELKPHTQKGWAKGKKQAEGYQQHLRHETVVLTYSVPKASMKALNDKVTGAWNIHMPRWRETWKNMTGEERQAAYEKVKPANPDKGAKRAPALEKKEEPPKQTKAKSVKKDQVKPAKNTRPRVAKAADSG